MIYRRLTKRNNGQGEEGYKHNAYEIENNVLCKFTGDALSESEAGLSLVFPYCFQ